MYQIQPIAWQVLAQMEAYPAEDLAEPVQEISYLTWTYNALGPLYILAFPVLGLLAFIGACLVVAKNRRPADIAAGVYFAGTPFVLGIFGVVHGMIASMQVVAMAGATPKPSEIANGASTSLFAALVGLLCSFPAYGVLALGYLVRSLMLRDGTKSGELNA